MLIVNFSPQTVNDKILISATVLKNLFVALEQFNFNNTVNLL